MNFWTYILIVLGLVLAFTAGMWLDPNRPARKRYDARFVNQGRIVSVSDESNELYLVQDLKGVGLNGALIYSEYRIQFVSGPLGLEKGDEIWYSWDKGQYIETKRKADVK